MKRTPESIAKGVAKGKATRAANAARIAKQAINRRKAALLDTLTTDRGATPEEAASAAALAAKLRSYGRPPPLPATLVRRTKR